MKDPAAHYFKCTNNERAVFEAGIKLGTIYHQFIGVPVNRTNVNELERAIENGVRLQPFVKKVRVQIDRKGLSIGKGIYKYKTLTGNMLRVKITIKYRRIETTCELRHVPEISYPLMYVKSIRNIQNRYRKVK